MCRIFGCVAREPVDIARELLRAENPLIRQSEKHDSGWGMAVYERAGGREPRVVVASERIGDGPWHDLGQDVLLTLDPDDPEEPHAERLLGDPALEAAEIVREQHRELRGEERGAFAARRAERLVAARG